MAENTLIGPLPGRIDGAAVSTGYVGEKFDFTSRTLTNASNGGYTATATIGSLAAGRWMVMGRISASGASLSGVSCFISTNSSNDSTGNIGVLTTTYSIETATGPALLQGTMIVDIVDYSSSTALYFKAISYGSTTNSISFSGFAIRIA